MCRPAAFPVSVTAFADSIRSADGVIIVSPEYNRTIPGTLKNAIDWVSRMKDQPFKNKPVALQSGIDRAAERFAHAIPHAYTALCRSMRIASADLR